MGETPVRVITLAGGGLRRWHELGSSQARPGVVVDSAENSRFRLFKQREINRHLTPYRVFGCGERSALTPNVRGAT
jgi:hypothetical protein